MAEIEQGFPEMRTISHLTVPPGSFRVSKGQLTIDGREIAAIVAETGDCPCYLYSRTAIEDALDRLRRAIPPSISIHYAIKANPLSSLVHFLADKVDGFDVASRVELELATNCIRPDGVIGFAGPGKSDDDIETAIQAGATLIVESAGELARIFAAASTHGTEPRIALRLNPDFELVGSRMKMAGGASPFGFDVDTVDSVLPAISDSPLHLIGMHIYAGTQCLDSSSICEALRRSVALIHELADRHSLNLSWASIGGGFGIPYFRGDEAVDIDMIGACLDEITRSMPATPRLIIELGRYIVGECGVYVTRVVDRKVSHGKTYLITDGGMHQHLAASGNLGQAIRRNFPVVRASGDPSAPLETVTICGRLCTPLDVLGRDVSLQRARPGDLVAILQSGAYGLTASPIRFLGHPPPAESLV